MIGSHIKICALDLFLAAGLTYTSLVVPGTVIALCSNVSTPVYCPVLAYGFPLPFIADNQGLSPVGSVARDPFSLFLGQDDLLWARLGLSVLFWLLLVIVSRATLSWRRHACRESENETK